MKRLLILLFLFASLALAKGPVYIVLWFDTEDYIDPAADDAALRIASDLTRLGVSATFKVTGEKARVLESRGRTDVIRALSHHAIGYHTNWHSVQPTEAVYLRRMGAIEGAEEFARREGPGLVDLKRVFGIQPICFGQPGSSWGPQAYPALRRLGVPVYLDEGEQVGLNDQPYWYGGLLSVYNMRRNLIRPDLTNQEKNVEINKAFAAAVENLSNNGGGVISTYFHPTEFVNAEFWDAANFKDGASRERVAWVSPAAHNQRGRGEGIFNTGSLRRNGKKDARCPFCDGARFASVVSKPGRTRSRQKDDRGIPVETHYLLEQRRRRSFGRRSSDSITRFAATDCRWSRVKRTDHVRQS